MNKQDAKTFEKLRQHGITDIYTEHQLILAKKSKLPASLRKEIVRLVAHDQLEAMINAPNECHWCKKPLDNNIMVLPNLQALSHVECAEDNGYELL